MSTAAREISEQIRHALRDMVVAGGDVTVEVGQDHDSDQDVTFVILNGIKGDHYDAICGARQRLRALGLGIGLCSIVPRTAVRALVAEAVALTVAYPEDPGSMPYEFVAKDLSRLVRSPRAHMANDPSWGRIVVDVASIDAQSVTILDATLAADAMRPTSAGLAQLSDRVRPAA